MTGWLYTLEDLAKDMKGKSIAELAEIVREGISAEVPYEQGSAIRVPTQRQADESYVAALELERRAGGKAPPIPVAEPEKFVISVCPPDEMMREAAKRTVELHRSIEAGTMPEPDWWGKPHPLTTEEEVEAELPTDATLKELEEKILLGMPSRGDEGVWHVPDAKELAEAKAALKVLVERADAD